MKKRRGEAEAGEGLVMLSNNVPIPRYPIQIFACFSNLASKKFVFCWPFLIFPWFTPLDCLLRTVSDMIVHENAGTIFAQLAMFLEDRLMECFQLAR